MVLGLACLCVACPQTNRPTVPQDVPVQIANPTSMNTSGDALDPTGEPLPSTPERAETLVLSEATQLKVPAGQAGTDLWFRFPAAKRPRSMQLTLSGGPDARWKLSLYRGDNPTTEALQTHQPEPGHPCRVSGIRATPDLNLWARVTRIWQREGVKASTMRLFAEAAIIRPGEEAEPNDNLENTPPEVPEKGRLEGILSHPGDKDCVSLPLLPEEPGEPKTDAPTLAGPQCLKARFHFEGPARRPFLVESYGVSGEKLSARTVRAPLELAFAPTDKDYGVRVCLKADDGSRSPQRWWVDAEPSPCPVPETPPEPEEMPERRFKVSLEQPTVVSGKLASQDAQHVLVIEAGANPALVRVEGPVAATWENPELKQFVLAPEIEGRLLIRIDTPPAEGDAPFPYWVQLKALDQGRVLPSSTTPTTLTDKRVYGSVDHNESMQFTIPTGGAANWRVEHLGERNSPPLKIKLLDNESRPVTSRTVLPANETALKLPSGFGPYTAQISLAVEAARPVAFGLHPVRSASAPPPDATP